MKLTGHVAVAWILLFSDVKIISYNFINGQKFYSCD